MLCRAIQGGRVTVESSEKVMWSTEGENGRPLHYSSHEQYEKAKRYDTWRWATQIRKCPVCYQEEQMAIISSSTCYQKEWSSYAKVEMALSCGYVWCESKVYCCAEHYGIGTQNVRSMNQGKLDVVKKEMARVNLDILEISERKWTGMGKFNSDDLLYLLVQARIP